MSLWAGPRRQQCIFCASRLLERQSTKRSRSQSYHATQIPPRQPTKERSLRIRDRGFDRPLDLRPAPRRDRDRGAAARKRFNYDFKIYPSRATFQSGAEPDIEQLTRQVLEQLPVLKQQLQPPSGVGENKALEPDLPASQQAQWDAFEDDIKLLLRQKKNGRWHLWKADRAAAFQELEEAFKKKTAAGHTKPGGLLKSLHFAFMDHVLSGDSSGSMSKYADLRYPTEWYFNARRSQREIHLHVGPTNSGKTYNALKRLEEAGNGFYAGPLRLLAYEVYSRFRAKGLACNLVTGDDIRLEKNDTETRLTSSTVEMVSTARAVDVAVIDEIQMMGKPDRGWAWTRAFLGANAKEVHLCGETRVVPLVRELAGSMGDTLHVHQYERLNPLKAMSRSLRGNLKNLRKGDCVVSFSIVGIHALKKQIELDTGRRVAIVYGSLPPDTRAQQAALFNDPDNEYDFLVASDAIGMGLNLSIKRIVFESVTKFNGVLHEQLSIPQLKQIAGRAGRYRSAFQDNNKRTGENEHNLPTEPASPDRAPAQVGLVTCLDERDLPYIQKGLTADVEPLTAAGIVPPDELIEDFATRLPQALPFEYVLRRMCQQASIHPRFVLCDIRDQLGIAGQIEDVLGLSIAQRCIFIASPGDHREPTGRKVLKALARCVAQQKSVTVADIMEIPLEALEVPMSPQREYLQDLERLHKALILFLWLSYRFVGIFQDQDMAIHAKELVEEKINQTLLGYSANPKLRKRLQEIKTMNAAQPSEPDVSGGVLVEQEPQLEDLDTSPALPMEWDRGSDLVETALETEHKAEPLAATG